MKALAPLLLAGAMSAQAQVKVPMTPELNQSVQNFVASSMMVCQKRKIPDKDCGDALEKQTVQIRKKVDEVCKDYPKEVVACTQYGLGYLMDLVTKKNILIFSSKDA